MQPDRDSLSAERLQLFVAVLSGLSRDEVRKAKSLYRRNAISEYRAAKTAMRGFQTAQGCMSIIPVFWPILWAQREALDAGKTLHEERIRNALHVWRDDLGDEAGALERLLAAE